MCDITGCWFYNDSVQRPYSPFPNAQYIRDWIGELSSIKIPGKFAARLGQGFSATFPSVTLQEHQVQVGVDVKNCGYCFSDGVGMLTESYAQRISQSMDLKFVPSAFQIRYAGAKGILTVVPDGFPPLGPDCEVRRE